MLRTTRFDYHASALRHNLKIIQQHAPDQAVMAMVKANAYGCGIERVVPDLDGWVEYFGVVGLNEAHAVAQLGATTPCVILQAGFQSEDWRATLQHPWILVLHQHEQLDCLLNTPLPREITVWVKLNTGMNRLGFQPHELPQVAQALHHCAWVSRNIVIMSHFANADHPQSALNQQQLECFQQGCLWFDSEFSIQKSLANSAAVLTRPDTHLDIIRPGIALYGVSPFEHQSARSLNLRPVIRFRSNLMSQFTIQPGESVGYGSCWRAPRTTRVGVIPAGYGDGYPRVVAPNTPVFIHHQPIPIIGRISMDSMTVDLTELPEAQIGDDVELWGEELPIEDIAQAANTIPYELLCKSLTR